MTPSQSSDRIHALSNNDSNPNKQKNATDNLHNTVHALTNETRESTKNDATSTILVNPQPLKLNIETSTDWPIVIATLMVGVGSVLTTLFVGWLTYVNQRNQIRSNKANFRHGWQIDLRLATAKFISITSKIHFELSEDDNYLSSSNGSKALSELLEYQVIIELMLDRSKQYTTEIIALLEAILEQLRGRRVDELTISANSLMIKVNMLLEQTWQDIRNDLDGTKV